MLKPYIRINGRYTAATENEKAAVQFIEEHLQHERVRPEEIRHVKSELTGWFRQHPEGFKTHTVKVNDGGKALPIIMTRVPRINENVSKAQ